MVAALLPMSTLSPHALAFIDACKLAVADARKATPKLTQDQAYAIIADVFEKHRKTQRKPTRPNLTAMTDEQFVAWLESQEVYAGLDVRREIGKCQVWCGGTKPTRMRVINWLNKADRTVGYDGRGQSSMKRQPAQTMEPHGWQDWINNNLPECVYAVGRENYPTAWGSLDAATRAHIERQMKL